LNSKWVQHDFSFVTGRDQGDIIPPPPAKEGPLHWNSGPPYLATVAGKFDVTYWFILYKNDAVSSGFFGYQDMYRIAIKWTEYAPKVLEIQDDIFAGEYL
jgi:hypothetical protein